MTRRLLFILVLLGVAGVAAAQQMGMPNVSINLGPQSKDSGEVATSLQILALLTVLSLAPAIMILTTAFTRITIILSFVRSAIGAQNIPPNQVMIGLSLFLTFFVMGPTFNEINETAIKPMKTIGVERAIQNAQRPIRKFMLKNTYERDLQLFLNITKQKPATRDEVELSSLIPAFIISELKTAFIVGFYIFVPFLIIDLIVASGLMSMGMMMLPPTVVSLPAKLLVFILADGWHLLVQTILQGYA